MILNMVQLHVVTSIVIQFLVTTSLKPMHFLDTVTWKQTALDACNMEPDHIEHHPYTHHLVPVLSQPVLSTSAHFLQKNVLLPLEDPLTAATPTSLVKVLLSAMLEDVHVHV